MSLLSGKGIKDKAAFEKSGIVLPRFSFDDLRGKTRDNPVWVHIGPGNIFRGYIAALAQKLIEDGLMQSGITAVSTFDHQIMDKIYKPYDNLALQVVMHVDGKLDKTVIASIGESLKAEAGETEQWQRLKEIFSDKALQMTSFTVTEKGYHIKGMDGEYYPDVLSDFNDGADGGAPKNGMAIVAALLLARYKAGGSPIAMVSMDNFSHNGSKLFDSVRAFAEKWTENGTAPKGFLAYVSNPDKVSFPWSMIDKITPRPDAAVAKQLEESGFESTELVITDKNTYIAPYVNAEAPQYLVIEDSFPNGRPPLEKAGVYMVKRETVDLVERMKVCTCLNPLHTAMAVTGCLLGYSSIAAEMKDATIVNLIKRIGYTEGMPVVADPGILKPDSFLDEVINVRLPNPFIPDTPQRIATDTSQKVSIRFGETIKLYAERPDLNVSDLKAIPVSIAAWCRYLLAIDDNGEAMAISSDPLLTQLQGFLAGVVFGSPESFDGQLKPILSNKQIFGLDLYAVDLGGRIEDYFKQMLTGKGAVRKTIEEALV